MTRYPKLPLFDDLSPVTVRPDEIMDYLNAVVRKYGPPCEHCAHFSDGVLCQKEHRPTRYDLKVGPFASFTIRKKCGDWTEGEEDDSSAAIERAVRLSLDCNSQQYG